MEMPPHFSYELKKLIEKVLKKNPDERPNIDKFLQDSWFEKFKKNNTDDFRNNFIFSKIMAL